MSREQEQRGVVVQMLAGLRAQFGDSFAKSGKSFARNLETKDVSPELWL